MERLPDRYDANASSYDVAVDHNRFAATRLVQSLPDREYGTVLDLGCGTGFATMAMLDRFPGVRSLVGVDVSEGMLEQLAGKLAGRTVDARLLVEDVAEAGDLQVVADAALCSMAYHWFTDRPAALGTVARHLRPGGIFGLVSPGVGHDREYVDIVRELDPPVPATVYEAFPRASIDPDALAEDLRRAGLAPLDIWVERRLRRTAVEAYLRRMGTVGSHTWHAIMEPDDVAAMLERIQVAVSTAAGPRGFEYTFTKTFALARLGS